MIKGTRKVFVGYDKNKLLKLSKNELISLLITIYDYNYADECEELYDMGKYKIYIEEEYEYEPSKLRLADLDSILKNQYISVMKEQLEQAPLLLTKLT